MEINIFVNVSSNNVKEEGLQSTAACLFVLCQNVPSFSTTVTSTYLTAWKLNWVLRND